MGGVLAFSIKLGVTLTFVQLVEESNPPGLFRTSWKSVLVVGLMNQLMSVVEHKKVAWTAVNRFLFARSDGNQQKEDWDREQVYASCVFRRIFTEFEHEPFKRAVAVTTFSLKELHMMVFEEDEDLHSAAPEDAKSLVLPEGLTSSHGAALQHDSTLEVNKEQQGRRAAEATGNP